MIFLPNDDILCVLYGLFKNVWIEWELDNAWPSSIFQNSIRRANILMELTCDYESLNSNGEFDFESDL